jgi:adenine-specific DNA-methyltransferase
VKLRPTEDKLRGGYYTPPEIATFLAKWAVSGRDCRILEPSCGDGNILHAVASAIGARPRRYSGPRIYGVELIPTEINKARQRLDAIGVRPVDAELINESFFRWIARNLKNAQRFDAAVGNPPFIRYQDFPEQDQDDAFAMLRGAGFHPTKLMNAWVPFIVLSSLLLAKEGRLAFVVPAELFQVNYASELRRFLAERFRCITIIAFRRLVFEGIQQEVVLLLAENAAVGPKGIRVVQVDSTSSLATLSVKDLGRSRVKPVDHAEEKWTKYFLSREEILLLRRLREREDIPLVRNFLDVDVGVVTGDNDFFVIDQQVVHEYNLAGSTVPIVGRTPLIPGLVFSRDELKRLNADSKRMQLFYPSGPLPTQSGPRRYIRSGEEKSVNLGYKCRIRKKWFVVPSVWTPDAFLLRQVDQFPKIVANHTGATCTDTIHRARVTDGIPPTQLACAFMNSFTFAASEITGRSYGGGVLTFEPSEIERMPLPVLGSESLKLDELDTLVRQRRVEEVLETVDDAVLRKGLGLSPTEIGSLRGAWVKLRDRRRGRKTR